MIQYPLPVRGAEGVGVHSRCRVGHLKYLGIYTTTFLPPELIYRTERSPPLGSSVPFPYVCMYVCT